MENDSFLKYLLFSSGGHFEYQTLKSREGRSSFLFQKFGRPWFTTFLFCTLLCLRRISVILLLSRSCTELCDKLRNLNMKLFS